MITKDDIVQMAQHVFRRSTGKQDGRIMHPRREWLTGLLIAAACLMGGSGYAMYVFITELNYTVDAAAVEVRTTTYKEELVRDVLQRYRAREEVFQALRAEGGASAPAQDTSATADSEGIPDGVAETNDIRVE